MGHFGLLEYGKKETPRGDLRFICYFRLCMRTMHSRANVGNQPDSNGCWQCAAIFGSWITVFTAKTPRECLRVGMFPGGDRSMATSGPSAVAGDAAAATKNSWPEVVGLSSSEAKKKIKEDKPDADVQVVPADAFVTMDYNAGRVRVFIDSNDKVAKAPRIG
ncbi:hypothetical protein BS78_08G057000 [Paspalum vaginatum]|nr:hypothetical protein BS78_08G057000 [Paspalum vaginatum]